MRCGFKAEAERHATYNPLRTPAGSPATLREIAHLQPGFTTARIRWRRRHGPALGHRDRRTPWAVSHGEHRRGGRRGLQP
jgi:hypothetical protein